MPPPVSPNLLATYLAVAARQALSGQALTDRSRWAIAHAQRQLRSDHDVLTGARPIPEGTLPAAVRRTGPAARPGLAAMTLTAARPVSDDLPREQYEERAAAHLEQVLTDLSILMDDAADRTPAAQRILSTFSAQQSAA